jgi:hypothetical protein
VERARVWQMFQKRCLTEADLSFRLIITPSVSRDNVQGVSETDKVISVRVLSVMGSNFEDLFEYYFLFSKRWLIKFIFIIYKHCSCIFYEILIRIEVSHRFPDCRTFSRSSRIYVIHMGCTRSSLKDSHRFTRMFRLKIFIIHTVCEL